MASCVCLCELPGPDSHVQKALRDLALQVLQSLLQWYQPWQAALSALGTAVCSVCSRRGSGHMHRETGLFPSSTHVVEHAARRRSRLAMFKTRIRSFYLTTFMHRIVCVAFT